MWNYWFDHQPEMAADPQYPSNRQVGVGLGIIALGVLSWWPIMALDKPHWLWVSVVTYFIGWVIAKFRLVSFKQL